MMNAKGGLAPPTGAARVRAAPLRAAWRLISAYWTSGERWLARGMLAMIIALDMLLVYRAVLITYWQKDFYDTLESHDLTAFWLLLGELAVLALAGVLLDTIRAYSAQALEMRWRSWLTGKFLERWLGQDAHWRIALEGAMENVDQRIAEDLKWLASNVLTLFLKLLKNTANLASFSVIVWELSGVITVSLAGRQVEIAGYMLWAALLYALLGSLAMEWLGRRMVAVDYRQQQSEADFRFLLVRVREHAEQIALLGGAQAECIGLRRRFEAIKANWRHIMTYTKRITLADRSYTEVGALVPYLLCGPRFFAGTISLGGLIQLVQAFMRVRMAFSWFIYEYKELALLRSVCRRLVELDLALDAGAAPASLRSRHGRRPGLRVRSLSVRAPDGTPLAGPLSWTILPGQRWLLTGVSGAGKSTLLRALAGLWPHCSGVISGPDRGRMLFLPQQSYLPQGSLRLCLSYPASEEDVADTACRQALHAVGLGALEPELLCEQDWTRRLSPGERQKLAFARILIQRPDYVFLDEATSALDTDSETALYGLLIKHCPGMTVVSVAHRQGLRRFHTDSLALPHADSAAKRGPAI